MARASLAILLIGLVGCKSAGADLTGAVAFETPAECRLAPHTLGIFGDMFLRDNASGTPRPAGPVNIAGVGVLQPTFRGPDQEGMVHAHLRLRGSWHGLTITGLGQGFIPHSGVGYDEILFAEPLDKVREKLNQMGFDLPSIGEAREHGDGMTEYIELRRRGSGSALECST